MARPPRISTLRASDLADLSPASAERLIRELQLGTGENNAFARETNETLSDYETRIAALEVSGSGVNTPHFKARRTGSAISLPHNTPTTVVCQTEDWDTDAMHDTSSGRITIPTTGHYRVTFSVKYDLGQLDHLVITFVAKNGGSGGGGSDVVYSVRSFYAGTATADYHQTTAEKTEILSLTAGDTLDLKAYQINTGSGTRSVGYATDVTWWEVQRVR